MSVCLFVCYFVCLFVFFVSNKTQPRVKCIQTCKLWKAKNEFYCFLALYRVPHTPMASDIYEKSMSEKWKIHEIVVTHFLEFIGFMVFKTTSLISRSFLVKKLGKLYTVARDISKINEEKLSKKGKYLRLHCFVSPTFSARMTVT